MIRSRSLVIATMIAFALALTCAAQKTEDPQEMKARAQALMDQLKYTDAVPIYATLARLLPKDPTVLRNFAFALMGQAANTPDAETRRQLRVRARDVFILARDAGDTSLKQLDYVLFIKPIEDYDLIDSAYEPGPETIIHFLKRDRLAPRHLNLSFAIEKESEVLPLS